MCGNGFLKAWDIRESKPRLLFNTCNLAYVSLGLSDNGRTVAATSWGGGALVYDVTSGRRLYRVQQANEGCLALSPDATRMAVKTKGVEVYPTGVQMVNFTLGQSIQCAKAGVPCFAEGLVRTSNAVYEAATGAQAAFDRRQDFSRRANPTPGRQGRRLAVHDLTTGFAVREVNLRSPGKNPPLWTLSPDGNYAAVAVDSGRIRIVDLARNQEVSVIKTFADRMNVTCLRFSPQDDLLAASYSDGGVRLWKWRSGELHGDLGKHVATSDPGVSAMAFSSDGKFLATGAGRSDRTIRIWRSPDWALLHVLTGHWNGIRSLAFSRDGSRLLSGGDDGTLRLWDPGRGQEILKVEAHEGQSCNAEFTDNDRAIASWDPQGMLRLWGGLSAALQPARPVDLLPWLRRSVDERPVDAGSTDAICLTSTDRRVIPVPVASAGNYILRGRFTRTRSGKRKTIGFLLPVGEGKTMLALDHEDRGTSGLDQVDHHGVGDPKHLNPTDCPVRLVDGKSSAFEARVEVTRDQAKVTVQLDGREIIRWQGPQQVLNLWPGWDVPDARMMGLTLGDVDVTVEQLELTPLDNGTRLLEQLPGRTAAPPPGTTVIAAPGTVDLLPLVDVEHGTIDAAVKKSDQGIEIEPAEAKFGRVCLPVWPRGGYELSGSFTLPEKASPVIIVPTMQSRGVVNWLHPDDASSALSMIDGKGGADPKNPTRIHPSKVQVGQRHVFRVRVVCEADQADVTVELDDQPYIHWNGPESAISVPSCWDIPHQRTLGVGVQNGRATFHELKLKMLDGKAWIPLPAAARSADAEHSSQ